MHEYSYSWYIKHNQGLKITINLLRKYLYLRNKFLDLVGISLYWYIGNLILTTVNVVSSSFNRAYSIISNKDNLNKENAIIKQVLKENGYQESSICKTVSRITNNHSLSQSQQQTHVFEI